MKISKEYTFEQISKLICGDTKIKDTIPQYLSGSQLVSFFNSCGFNDEYKYGGFPTRWKYVYEKLKEANDTELLNKILENYVDPTRFGGDEKVVKIIIDKFNDILKYEGYKFQKVGLFYKIIKEGEIMVEIDAYKNKNNIDHVYISQEIEKCKHKINNNDFKGAITSARTLCETVLIHAIELLSNEKFDYKGNILVLYKKLKNILNGNEVFINKYPSYFKEILSGIYTCINGLTALRNNASDSHANKFNTQKHHAKLAVNLSLTICDFIIDLLNELLEEKNIKVSKN